MTVLTPPIENRLADVKTNDLQFQYACAPSVRDIVKYGLSVSFVRVPLAYRTANLLRGLGRR